MSSAHRSIFDLIGEAAIDSAVDEFLSDIKEAQGRLVYLDNIKGDMEKYMDFMDKEIETLEEMERRLESLKVEDDEDKVVEEKLNKAINEREDAKKAINELEEKCKIEGAAKESLKAKLSEISLYAKELEEGKKEILNQLERLTERLNILEMLGGMVK